MFVLRSIFLLVLVAFSCGQSTNNRVCAPDNVDFKTKVDKSSVIVYGKTMAKMMNEGSDSIFHIFFQVDCVLKGPATLRQINITNAGRAANREYCQEFPVGRGYAVAFLEPASANQTDHKTFIPADFVEVLDDGKSVEQLLAKTCSLHRLVPLHSVASVSEICPAVATDPLCLLTNNTLDETSSTPVTVTATTTTTHVHLVENKNQTDGQGHLSRPIHTPQQEIDAIRSKSGTAQVDADQRNAASPLIFTLNGVILPLIVLLFCRFI